MDFCEAFGVVAELGGKLGKAPLNKTAGCWEEQIDEYWWIAVNGHKEPVACSKGAVIDPWHIYIEFNGWPAGMINPAGGTILAGECANEDAFIEAVKARTAQPNPPATPPMQAG